MSKLLVFGVDSPATAEKVLDLARDLAKQQLLELADAAWVERTQDGGVKLHQSVNLTAMMAGSGAVTGALWGTLIGLLFLNPWLERLSEQVSVPERALLLESSPTLV